MGHRQSDPESAGGIGSLKSSSKHQHAPAALPHSNAVALLLPFTEPTSYGLGKSGWVSAKFPPGKKLPVDMLKAWIDESYRAQAPKKLVRSLDPEPSSEPAAKARSKKRRR